MAEAATAVGALRFVPKRLSISSMREAVQGCRGCPLYKHATQAVFGAGSRSSRVILVGEQPGNDEDVAGAPFVGPAGRILDRGLAAAGIARSDAYVTNVVKHFKWEPRGKRRLHKRPSAGEIAACLPWLQREIELIKPEVLVCLGATAAQSLLGRDFRVTLQRGRLIETSLALHAMATVHPSSILRQRTDADRQREMRLFIEDLKAVARLL